MKLPSPVYSTCRGKNQRSLAILVLLRALPGRKTYRKDRKRLAVKANSPASGHKITVRRVTNRALLSRMLMLGRGSSL